MNPAPMTMTRHDSTVGDCALQGDESSSVRSVKSPSRCPSPSVPGRRLGVGPRGQHDCVRPKDGAVIDLDLTSFDVQPHGAMAQDLVHPQFAAPSSCRPGRPSPAATSRPGPVWKVAAGRKGRCNSSPTSVMVPWKPSARSVSTARQPASDAPTTTTVPSTGSPSVVIRPRTWRSTPRASGDGTRSSSCGSRPCSAKGRREYRWPGKRTASSGTRARRLLMESYMASGSDPGRSVRPQPSRKRVSPATRRPSTKKHWLPGVCPGVWISSTSTEPTWTTSPLSWPTRCDALTPVVRSTQGTSSFCRWIGTWTDSKSVLMPSRPHPAISPPT